MAQIPPLLPDPDPCPVTLSDGWKATDLKTWSMRVCEHETGAFVVFVGRQVVVHRSDGRAGRQAAGLIEEQLRAANYVVIAGGPDDETVLYRLGSGEMPGKTAEGWQGRW